MIAQRNQAVDVMRVHEQVSCSYTLRSVDGRGLQADRLFTHVAMATITELKCGKRLLPFLILSTYYTL